MQQDPIGYAEGMNAYEYTKSSPQGGVDPQGTVVVILTGAGAPRASMEPIRKAIVAELKRRMRKYDDFGNEPRVRSTIYAKNKLWDDAEWKAITAYVLWRARKIRDHPCRLEQFIAVGHSSGASGMYRIANGKGWAALERKGPPRLYLYPAYLGFIDMILPFGERHEIRHLPPFTLAEHSKLPWPWTPSIHGIRNFTVHGVNHMTILTNAKVIRSIANHAGGAYESAVVINRAAKGVPARWRTSLQGDNQW